MTQLALNLRRATQRQRGFSLIELLVAVAVFAVAGALAYAGLAAVTHSKQRLQQEQQAFQQIQRSVGLLARDLGSAVDRRVRDADGRELPSLLGSATRIEFSHHSPPGPPALARPALERVVWFADGKQLQRGRFAVLDRAPNSVPALRTMHSALAQFNVRYLDHSGNWHLRWPPSAQADNMRLPRAVEFRMRFASTGEESTREFRRVIELASGMPQASKRGTTP